MTSGESERQQRGDALLSGAATAAAQLGSGHLVNVGSYPVKGRASSTDRAYQSDWADFTAWCTGLNLQAVPASGATVAAYIANLATPPENGGCGRRPSTVRRRLASIAQAHQSAGLRTPTNDPLVRRAMAGIVREHGGALGRKLPIRLHHLKLMVSRIPSNPIGVRDKALLLLGFAGAFRRSELVAIDRGNLQFVPEGVKVFMPTPRTGAGESIGILYGKHPETCPVRALRTWLELLPDGGGPVFRRFDRWGHIREARLTDEWVAEVVKQYVQSIGLAPDQFAGHSLRAGLATSAAAGGATERSIMNQTRHRSTAMLRRYIRDADVPMSANAVRFTGL